MSMEYRQSYNSNSEIKEIVRKVNSGKADYQDAEKYSQLLGTIANDAISSVSSEDLPNGRMYYNIAQKTIEPILKQSYSLSSKVCKDVQNTLNQSAGIGMKAVVPNYDEYRANGILNLASIAENYDDVKNQVGTLAEVFTSKVADNSVKENAKFQYESGLSPKVVRVSANDCCDWCAEVAGTYDYAEVKASGNNVWRRHENCMCSVYYDPGTGRRQNAHTKEWVNSEEKQERVDFANQIDIVHEIKEDERINNIEPDFYVGLNGKVLEAKYKYWIGENKRNYYLNKAKSVETVTIINELYRPGSFIGDGGTAAIRKFEKETSLNCGRILKNGEVGNHKKKVQDSVKWIQRILLQDIPSDDKILLEELLDKLKEVDE